MLKQPKETNKNYYTDIDIWETYENPHKITKAQFNLALHTFVFAMIKSIIDEGKVYYLPPKLGKIGITKGTNKGKKILDYDYFKKTGDKKYHKNFHSSGYLARFNWMKDFTRFNIGNQRATNVFDIKLCRYFSRYLASQIKNNNVINKYYDY